MGLLPAAEHDRDLHLRALVEESFDVALLGAAVVVDQPDAGGADRIVDARRVAWRRADLVEWPASGPQRQITKLGLLLLVSLSQHEKPLTCSGPFPRQCFDSVEPPRSVWPGR